MPWFKIKRKLENFPLSDDNLDPVIKIFEVFFKEWNDKKDVFSDEKSISFDKPEFSLQITQLKENQKADVDKLIKELRDDLKYNFFSVFWEKKENLKLIEKLKKILVELDNKIMKQNQELLNLEKNKSLIEKNKIKEIIQDNVAVFDGKDYFSFFNFLSKKVNDISYLTETNSNIFNNKKIFLNKIWELKNKINIEIQDLYQRNKELENKNNKIFEKLFQENVMTQLILSFWALRMKNDSNKYTLSKKLKNKPNENFSYFFDLIDVIFNRYLKKLLKMKKKYSMIYLRNIMIKNQILKKTKKNLSIVKMNLKKI